MTETIIELVKLIIAILPFVSLCFASKKINLPESERSRQFIMPVIAFVYVIIAMIFVEDINDWLLRLIESIPNLIAYVSKISLVPEKVAAIFVQIASYVKAFLDSLNLKFWIFFISNAVIMAFYLTLKSVCIRTIDETVKYDGWLFEKIAQKFYEYFPERGKWCLFENFVQTRGFLEAFYISAVVISAALMISTRKYYDEGLMKSLFYPVFGVLVIGELFFYLDGPTKIEYSEKIIGEEEEAYKKVNYSLLRKFLRSIYSDKLLAEETSVNNALSYDMTTDDFIHELEKSEDHKTVNFAEYMKMVKGTGFTIDNNYLFSSLDLLNGKSVLFNNPFYNDLIPYAFYPMNRALLSHQKVLVVLGRHAIENDIIEWIRKGVESVTNIPYMWNIEILGKEPKMPDIGVITRSDVLGIDIHNANAEFLESVGYVVIIEPSKLVSTAQIGLNLIVKQCRKSEDKEIVYCMCDKNCDGLVDALSHILMTSITEVSATNKHLGTSSYMCWEVDEEYTHHRLLPNISRYLGFGTELSFAALKNQVSKTKWFGGEAFPVADMRWIAKQYYYDLTKYAGVATTQESMDDRFVTSPNFWSATAEKNTYITVEDESNNMFEILRDFSTRTTEQGFVNVISSDYLLKDYMADNASIFETDAKAIPYIVADYTRSNRNTLLRLILMMSTTPVSEDILESELSLLNIPVFDLKKQLWFETYNCYASVAEVASLPENYKEAVEEAFNRKIADGRYEFGADIFDVVERFNLKKGVIEITYSITDKEFLRICVSELRSAGYIAEDEKGDKHYLGAELCGHIYQRLLPGQFFTFDGKYYEMMYLTADGKALVRRAADHINGRPNYRQKREYVISGLRASEKVGSQKNISGLKVFHEFADITVNTSGYYSMNRYNDFASAREVLFEGTEKNGIPSRKYRNKEILRIELPDFGGKLNENIRYTIAVLFNEVFKTIFAENQAYISAVTDDSFFDDESQSKPLTYSVKGDGCEVSSNCIYIIEDSQLDLGLTVTVERNLERIFRIIFDYLEWHRDTLDASLNPKPDPEPPIIFSEEKPEEPENPEDEDGFFSKLRKKIRSGIDKIKKFFKKKRKKGENQPELSPEEEETTETAEPETKNMPAPAEPEETEGDEGAEGNERSEEEETEDTGESEDEADNGDEAPKFERKPYHKRYYLLYGGEGEMACIDPNGTLDYLNGLGFSNNPLSQARKGKKIAEYVEATFKPEKPDARYCDFCGAEIYGVEYETLADGRDRCLICSRTAVKTEEEFRALFEDVKRNMESFFGIRINAGIRIKAVNSRMLHKKLGSTFIPTSGYDGRVLGVAIEDRNGFTIMVENGAPRLATMLTLAHELTHIWQYLNWDKKAIIKKYGRKMRLEVYEGMAKWAEIQYAYLINEPAVAKREEIITMARDDEYGRGFLRYRANYPFSLGTVITKPTPFMNVDTPLAPEYCTAFVYVDPNGKKPSGGEGGDGGNGGGIIPGGGKKPIKGPVQRNPEKVLMYAYEQLSESEKAVYKDVVNAVNNFEPCIENLSAQVDTDQISRIIDYVDRDHPEMIWFNRGVTYSYDTSTRIVSKLDFTYCLSPEETKKRQGEIKKALKSFVDTVSGAMSDYELTLRIYENIIRLVDYDTIGLERQKRFSSPKSEKPDDLRSIYGVFVNNKAVCAGYAKATQYLLNMHGIECTYVTSDTHAWNMVKLEGDYYHIDTTWGDGSNTSKEKNVSDRISYDCFCITTKELLNLESHVPEDILPLPDCTATKCNYHHRHGLFFKKYDCERIKDIIVECVGNDVFDVTLKFADKKVFREAHKSLIDNGKFSEAVQSASLKTGVRISHSYTYNDCKDRLILTFHLSKL